MTGTATSSTGQALTFTMPAGTFASVLHYVAPIRSDQIQRHDATFQFTIPARVAGLAGTKVTVKVHDGELAGCMTATPTASPEPSSPVPHHRRAWRHRAVTPNLAV